jgi:hypothetical protein
MGDNKASSPDKGGCRPEVLGRRIILYGKTVHPVRENRTSCSRGRLRLLPLDLALHVSPVRVLTQADHQPVSIGKRKRVMARKRRASRNAWVIA